MGKYIWLVETIFIAMMYVGCGNVTNLKNDIESNALLEDKQREFDKNTYAEMVVPN